MGDYRMSEERSLKFTVMGQQVTIPIEDKGKVQVYSAIKEVDASPRTGFVFPITVHQSEATEATTELRASCEMPDISGRWGFDVYTTFDLNKDDPRLKFLDMLKGINPDKTQLSPDDLVAANSDPIFFKSVLKLKSIISEIKNELRTILRDEKEFTVEDTLTIKFISLVNEMVQILVYHRSWKNLNWELKYWGVAITGKDGIWPPNRNKNTTPLIPGAIVIKINENARVRFELTLIEPAWHQRTGARIRHAFFYQLSHIFNLPWGFLGIREYLNTMKRLDAKTLLASPTSEADEFQKWYNFILAILADAKNTLVLQPLISIDKLADLIITDLLWIAMTYSMNTKYDFTEVKEVSDKMDENILRTRLEYAAITDDDAITTWRLKVSHIRSKLGYPISGPSSWFAFPDLALRLEKIQFFGVKFREINTSIVVNYDDMISIDAEMCDLIMSKDNKPVHIPSSGATIQRSGKIILDNYNETTVSFIKKVDNYLSVVWRSEPFRRPRVTIDFVDAPSEFTDSLKGLNLKDAYFGVGWLPECKGIMLPLTKEALEKMRAYPEYSSRDMKGVVQVLSDMLDNEVLIICPQSARGKAKLYFKSVANKFTFVEPGTSLTAVANLISGSKFSAAYLYDLDTARGSPSSAEAYRFAIEAVNSKKLKVVFFNEQPIARQWDLAGLESFLGSTAHDIDSSYKQLLESRKSAVAKQKPEDSDVDLDLDSLAEEVQKEAECKKQEKKNGEKKTPEEQKPNESKEEKKEEEKKEEKK